MNQRRKWTAIPGLLALAAGAVILSAYSGASSSQGNQPKQPVAFPHTVHVAKLGMNCLYCHYSANKSPDAGMPAVGTCMGCHTVIGAERPASDLGPKRHSVELEKLTDYYKNGAGVPVPWVRIDKLPEYVRFPHMRHVNAGVTCQSCHGRIQDMGPNGVFQQNSLNMGWCVSCHVNGYSEREGLQAAGYAPTDTTAPIAAGTADSTAARKKASFDCAVCHY